MIKGMMFRLWRVLLYDERMLDLSSRNGFPPSTHNKSTSESEVDSQST